MTSRRQRNRARKLVAQTKRALANNAIHLPLAAIETKRPEAVEAGPLPATELVETTKTLPKEMLRSDTILLSQLQKSDSRLRESVDRLREFGATQKAVDELKAQGVHTIEDLQAKTNRDMLEWPRFGSTRVARVRDAQEKFLSH